MDQVLEFIELNQYLLPYFISALVAIATLTWVAISVWAWRDITRRTRSIIAIVASFLLVLFGGLLGLVVYLLVRPEHTIEEDRNMQLFHASVLDENINSCHNCGMLVRNTYKHCPNCAAKLHQKCPHCHKRVNPNWKACVSCGTSLLPLPFWRKIPYRKMNRASKKVLSFGASLPGNIANLVKQGWHWYVNRIEQAIDQFTKMQAEKNQVKETNKEEEKNEQETKTEAAAEMAAAS